MRSTANPMTIETAPSTTLDLKGLNCPLPALRTLKALKAMSPGATLIVECTDPMAAIDVPHCVLQNGDAIECQSDDGAVLRFRIRRGAVEISASAETGAGLV